MSPRHIAAATAVMLAAALPLARPAAAQAVHGHNHGPNAVIQGAAQPLGKGMAYAWVAVDDKGTARQVGISITEAALTGLAAAPRKLLLDLPEPARKAGYDHVALDWEPHGHPPPGIYDKPHFDVHFYHATTAQQLAILPTDPQYNAKMAKAPPANQLPAGYIRPPGTDVPMMGTHWINPKATEFTGQPFTHTLIYGTYNGAVTFLEPMVTLAFLQKRETATAPVPAPTSSNRAIPRTYTIGWDANAGEHSITLDDLAPIPMR